MDVDISLMGYEQWVRFLFEHPVPEEGNYESSWKDNITCEVSQPVALIEHVTRMCGELVQIGQRYTAEQVDQGIWFLLSYPAELGLFLLNTEVPVEQRIECVRAMYRVYADYVTILKSPVPNCFDMWWDLICASFWSTVRHRLQPINLAEIDLEKVVQDAAAALMCADKVLSGEVVNSEDRRQESMAKKAAGREAMGPQLTEDECMVFEAMFETLQRILELPNDVCRYSALHGLGHLHHPGVRGVIQRFLDGPGQDWSPDGKKWLRECAEGRIM